VWVIVHVWAGLGIGAALEWPLWAVAAVVLASHLVLDLVPHWDYTRGRHATAAGALDLVASLTTGALCLTVWHTPLAVVALGALSGAPDAEVVVRALRGGRGRYFFPSHWDAFPHGACGPVPGIATQACVVAAAAAAFFAAGAH
jgi:hypothetical protein